MHIIEARELKGEDLQVGGDIEVGCLTVIIMDIVITAVIDTGLLN